jgi:hypothetical protein
VVNMNITPNDTVCAGATATFTPIATNGGSAPAYEWFVNGFPVSLSNTYSFIPADGDIVKVQMASTATCANPVTVTHTVRMTVNPFGFPHADVILTPNDTVCKGTVVTATAATTYGGTAPYYVWFRNGTLVPVTGPSISFGANNGDQVFVVLYSNDPCRLGPSDSSAIVRVVVDTPVQPIVTITGNPGITVGRGQNDTLHATVTNAVNPAYQWYINGIPVTGATTPTLVYSSYATQAEDSVSCQVTSNGVCTITGHQWVYIKVSAEGVSQITGNASDITVGPNPNKGEFMIRGSLGTTIDEEVSLEITDILGQVVYKDKVTAKNGKMNQEISLSGSLANGMYILTLRSETESKVFHVVVEQ